MPAIDFQSHPELSAFECPEWSHLSAEDSVKFTRRLVPHLMLALQDNLPQGGFAGGGNAAFGFIAP